MLKIILLNKINHPRTQEMIDGIKILAQCMTLPCTNQTDQAYYIYNHSKLNKSGLRLVSYHFWKVKGVTAPNDGAKEKQGLDNLTNINLGSLEVVNEQTQKRVVEDSQ